MQESGSPPVEKCVHVVRNSRFVTLYALPIPGGGQPIPPTYGRERDRLATEIAKVKGQVRSDDEQEKALNSFQDQKRQNASSYDRIQSEYAAFNQYTENVKSVKDVTQSLRPLRPPTAPSSDLEIERQKILALQAPHFLFIQIVLGLLVTALVSYVVLPAEYAHGIAFLLLSMAISFGFFLRK
jgi:hypothetical protein